MAKRALCAAALLAAAVPAWAGIESIQVTGEGISRADAIDAALISAIEQVVGVDIDSVRHNSQEYQETEEAFTFAERSSGTVNFGTAGNATYRILSELCDQGDCTVRLLANVEFDDDQRRQKALKGINGKRRTIAIEPFAGNRHAATLTQAIEDRFVQDRLFAVVADQEQAGVDYLLRGKVLEAATRTSTVDTRRTVKLTGETIGDVSSSYSSRVVVQYQLIDLINNQIKWSAKVPTTSSRNNLSLLLDIAGRKVFDQLKDNIYPMVLFASNDGNLVLNSGGKTVQQGETYDVFAVGEELFDPYTEESLGFTENKVGQVKVTKVQHKVAYVTLLSGDKAQMMELPIVRRAQAAKAPAPKVAQPTPKEAEPRKKTSGIVL